MEQEKTELEVVLELPVSELTEEQVQLIKDNKETLTDEQKEKFAEILAE